MWINLWNDQNIQEGLFHGKEEVQQEKTQMGEVTSQIMAPMLEQEEKEKEVFYEDKTGEIEASVKISENEDQASSFHIEVQKEKKEEALEEPNLDQKKAAEPEEPVVAAMAFTKEEERKILFKGLIFFSSFFFNGNGLI